MDNCIFCKIINKEAPANIIYEDDKVIVITSLETHPLVIPKTHVEDIFGLSDEDGAEIMKAAIKVSKAVKKSLNCDGLNLVQSNGAAAGQDVFHFHLHLKPRWKDDGIKLHWNTDEPDFELMKEMTEKIKAGLD